MEKGIIEWYPIFLDSNVDSLREIKRVSKNFSL